MTDRRAPAPAAFPEAPGSRPTALTPARTWRVLQIASWLVFAAVSLFTFAWLLPHKGVDFADEGWYLQAALAAARGQGLDSLIPQAPFYLVNAAFMRLGLEGYLAQRWLYEVCILLGLAPLFLGLARGRGGPALPLVLAVGELAVLTSILSYENGPVLCCAAGLGLFYLASDAADRRVGRILAALSGAALALGSFMSFALTPAALLCCGLFWLTRREAGVARAAVLSFLILFGAAAGLYLGNLGLAEFLRMPDETHGLNWPKLADILVYAAQWPILFGALFGGCRLAGRRWPGASALADRLVWILLPALSLLVFLLCLQKALAPGLTPALAAFFAPFSALGLSFVGQLHLLLPFQLLLFLGFALASLALVATAERTADYGRLVAAVLAVGACWVIQVFFSTAYVGLKVFFAAPLLACALPRLQARAVVGRGAAPRTALAVLWGSGCLMVGSALIYALTYVHPGAVTPFRTVRALDLPRLEGILETPERAATLERLLAAYRQAGCEGKSVFVFKFSNLLHYVFDKKAPDGLSYILPVYRFPEERILKELTSGTPWCVFVSKNYEVLSAWDKVEPLLARLEVASAEVVRLGNAPPRHLYDDFTLYVGPGPGAAAALGEPRAGSPEGRGKLTGGAAGPGSE